MLFCTLHSAFDSEVIVYHVPPQTLVTLDEAHGDEEEVEEDKMEEVKKEEEEVVDTTVAADSLGK